VAVLTCIYLLLQYYYIKDSQEIPSVFNAELFLAKQAVTYKTSGLIVLNDLEKQVKKIFFFFRKKSVLIVLNDLIKKRKKKKKRRKKVGKKKVNKYKKNFFFCI
jgi:hypothetical protein